MRNLIVINFARIFLHQFIWQVLVMGSPVIVGPPNVTVQENTAVSLTCTYTSETNPWYLSWTRNDADLLPVNFRTTPCELLYNNDAATIRTQRYQITCSQTQSTYTTTLTIPAENVTEYEHNTIWKCNSFLDNGISNGVTLFVTAPVKWVILTVPTHVFITPGTSASLTCETSASRPSASVDWYINGSHVTSSKYNIVSNFSGNSTDGPRLATISTIQIPWEDGGWNQTVRCSANNVNTVKSNTSTVVHVSPGLPTILPATNDSIFYEGSTATLQCTQRGGNPTPTISWSGACVNGNGVNIVSDALTVNFSRTMHHSLCYCITTAYNGDASRTTAIILTVFYPPSNVVIRGVPPFPWQEHETGALYCSADAGYPSNTMYKWINSTHGMFPGSNISFHQLTPNDHNKSYTCQVENNYTVVKNTIISKNVALQVEYSPTISLDISTIEVIEGRDIKRECHATGNPFPNVSWWYNNIQVQAASGAWAELAISNISRTLNGTYTCKATAQSKHGLLKAEKHIEIDIFYPPDVEVQVKIENNTATINCLAHSNPKNATVVDLMQTYNGITIRQFPHQQNLSLSHLTYQDMGKYICSATNGIPNRRNNTIIPSSGVLKVEYAAEFCNYTEDVVKFYFSFQTNNTIKIVFISSFNLSISDIKWLNKTSVIESSEKVQFDLETTSTQCKMFEKLIDLQGYAALMYLKNFNKHNIGNYTLEVKKKQKFFHLIPSGPPENPKNFTVIKYDHNSITLMWRKGLNGGFIQYFIIGYSDAAGNNLPIVNITETTDNQYSFRLTKLQPSSFYQVKLYAQNEKGKTLSSIVNVTTKTEEKSSNNQNSSLVTGVASSAAIVVVVLSIIFGVFILKKRKNKKGDESPSHNRFDTRKSVGDDDTNGMKTNVLYATQNSCFNEDDGLTKNVLYETAGKLSTQAKEETSVTTGASGDIYAVVCKPKDKRHENVADKNKQKEVKKQNKGGKEQLTTNERYKNQNGLTYVKISFKENSKNKTPVIHGLENKTEYAIVDFNRKADTTDFIAKEN